MSEAMVRLLEERLDDYVDDLRTLVGIDSPSLDKVGVDAVVDWLEQRMMELGFAVQRHRQTEFGDDLLGTLKGSGRGRILFLGHTDTVFPAGTAAERPMTIRDDKIVGPGTCDMKSGLLTGLYAVEALQEVGFDEFESLSFLCVSDEECGQRHSIPLIRSQSRRADVVLTLEAARQNGDVVTGRKALRWYTVEAFGHAAHAGVEPERGRSAILALAHHIVQLDRLNGLWPGATLTTGYIEGGSLPSVVPGYARMRLDLRALTDADMQALEEAVHAQLGKTEVPGVTVTSTLEEGSVFPAMELSAATLELEKLAQEAARELGFEIKGTTTGGASDANYAAAEGRPVLDGLGPVGGLDHGPDEYIELSSIVPRTALLAKLVVAVLRRGGER